MPSTHPGGGLRRAVLGATASLSVVIAVVTAIGAWAYNDAQRNVRHFRLVDEGGSASGQSDKPERDFGPCVDDVCNYLILGSDSRKGLPPEQLRANGTDAEIGGENRSDTIMLVHTDPAAEKAVILSFPRDLWVNIPGHGQDKINAAFEGGLNGGGPQLVSRTIENLTGLDVNHVLYVNLWGFQQIVDTVGGVDLCIPEYLADPTTGRIVDPLVQLDITPGCQRLNGQEALGYVRTRHLRCDTIPDFSRIGRQQQFLRAVLNRLLTPSQIAQAPSLLGPVARNLVVDQGFKLADVIFLVKQLEGISTGAAEFRSVPGTPELDVATGLAIVRMNPEAREIFRAVRHGQPLPPIGTSLAGTSISEAQIEVPVIDHASGGDAQAVEDLLAEAGFNVGPGIVSFARAGIDQRGTVIAYGPGHDAEASVVQKYLPNVPTAEVAGLKKTPVAVLVTSAWEPAEEGTPEQPGATDCPTVAT